MQAQKYRSEQLKHLTDSIGVYALCDLDDVPIYIGQSVDGIRSRVRRHLTSARSDIIANRQIDVWEISYVWAWPLQDKAHVEPLESYLFWKFHAQKPLMNGKIPRQIEALDFDIPELQRLQIITDEDLGERQSPENRLPRQIMQYLNLVDYMLNVKNSTHLSRSLEAHFDRLVDYHQTFLK